MGRLQIARSRLLNAVSLIPSHECLIVHCPLVAIWGAPDAAPVEAWIRRVIVGEYEELFLYAGEGFRRHVGFADRAGLKDHFVAALGRVNKITRGTKPVRALREIGLCSDLAAKVPTTDGIIAALEGETLHACEAGIQIYGQEPDLNLVAFLELLGAMVDIVAPYIYSLEADDQ
jgi:uroporphyrinogen-III synthase